MRLVIQRVSQAKVTINQKINGEIQQGLMILLGIGHDDTTDDIDWLVRKVVAMRIFDDADGVMNRSVLDVDGNVLVVSQFTLMASTKKGNRPSWIFAAPHEIAIPLYNEFLLRMSAVLGKPVAHGEFGANMQVSLVNDGPVTIVMDSKNRK